MFSFTHQQIWNAFDAIAKANGTTPSGLARRAGLDATSFNKSKRVSPSERERWPSTETLSKILFVTGMTLTELDEVIQALERGEAFPPVRSGAQSMGEGTPA
jgi:phage repressor protein C with HTH and peptisase S24 domain